MGEGGCCCRLKKQRSYSELSHRKILGLEATQGSPARVSLTRSWEQRSPLHILLRQSSGRALHGPAPSPAHTPSRSRSSVCTPTSSTLVFVMLFFTRKKKENSPVLSQVIFGFLSELPEGKQGVQVISSCR